MYSPAVLETEVTAVLELVSVPVKVLVAPGPCAAERVTVELGTETAVIVSGVVSDPNETVPVTGCPTINELVFVTPVTKLVPEMIEPLKAWYACIAVIVDV